MQYLNNKYALTLCESVKVVLDFQWPTALPKCVGLGIKLAHDVAQGPACLRLNLNIKVLALHF